MVNKLTKFYIVIYIMYTIICLEFRFKLAYKIYGKEGKKFIRRRQTLRFAD